MVRTVFRRSRPLRCWSPAHTTIPSARLSPPGRAGEYRRHVGARKPSQLETGDTFTTILSLDGQNSAQVTRAYEQSLAELPLRKNRGSWLMACVYMPRHSISRLWSCLRLGPKGSRGRARPWLMKIICRDPQAYSCPFRFCVRAVILVNNIRWECRRCTRKRRANSHLQGHRHPTVQEAEPPHPLWCAG